MKKLWMALFVLLLSLPAGVSAQEKKDLKLEDKQTPKIPEEFRRMLPGFKEHPMVIAEQDFSKMSAEKGIQQAFLTYLADDAIIFRPEPISGRQWFSDQAELKGSLTWEPTYVEIAGSGELGLSTGTYQYLTPSTDGKPGRLSHGHFVSVWEKKVVGWRVILDHGIAHSKPSGSAKLVFAPIPETKSHDWDENINALFEVDKSLGELTSKEAFADAYEQHGDDDLRIYREGHLPLNTKKVSLAGFAELPIVTSSELEGAGVSRAKDLAFTYGNCTITDLKKDTRGPGTYIRIWRKAAKKDEWKLILDLATPHPPEAEES